MFGRSYAKIQRMKGAFLNPNIEYIYFNSVQN